LTSAGNQLWHQDTPGIPGAAEAGDRFGAALAGGDLDGDGTDDLAIGVPGEDVGTRVNAGGVNVIYGSPSGLQATAAQFWSQHSPGVPGIAEKGDAFGAALAIADYGRSSRADVAIGVPGEDVGQTDAAGSVEIIYGRAGGLGSTGAQSWSQNTVGVVGRSERLDGFGWALSP
jgi:hypothetical protein